MRLPPKKPIAMSTSSSSSASFSASRPAGARTLTPPDPESKASLSGKRPRALSASEGGEGEPVFLAKRARSTPPEPKSLHERSTTVKDGAAPKTLRDLPLDILTLIAGAASATLSDARFNLGRLMLGAGYARAQAIQTPRLEPTQQRLIKVNPSLLWSTPSRQRTLEHYFQLAGAHRQTLDWLSEMVPANDRLDADGEPEEIEPRWLSADRSTWVGLPATVSREEVGLAVRARELLRSGASWTTTSPKAFYMSVLEHSADVIRHTPQACLDMDFYQEALDTSGGTVAYAPRELLTPVRLREILNQEPALRDRVPADLLPLEHRVMLIDEQLESQSFQALDAVANPLLLEICQALIEYNPASILALNTYRLAQNAHTPQTERARILEQNAQEGHRLAVSRDPELFAEIDPAMRSEAVCLAAVTQDGMLLAHVPEERLTLRVCAAAVRNNPMALPRVPEALQAAVMAALAAPAAQGAARGGPA